VAEKTMTSDKVAEAKIQRAPVEASHRLDAVPVAAF